MIIVSRCNLVLVLFATACSAPLREPPPLMFGAPEIDAGFYSVHRIKDGAAVEERGADPLGDVVFLHNLEYLQTGLFSDGLRFLGISGVFEKSGKIRSEASSGRIVHKWEYKDDYGNLVIGEWTFVMVDVAADPPCFEVRLGNHIPVFQLRFLARRPPLDRSRTLVIAHRGTYYYSRPYWNANALYPANTLPAFRAALDTGFQGFEADLRITRDKKWVVSHDQDISVATDGEGLVCERTLEELEACTVLYSPLIPERSLTAVGAYIAAPMCGFKETLRQFLHDDRAEAIVVDIKPDTVDNIRHAAADALAPFSGSPDLDKLLFVAHDEESLLALKELSPGSRFALEGDVGSEAIHDPESWIPELEGKPRRVYDTLSVNLGMYLSPILPPWRIGHARDFMEAARRHGYSVMAWTVNDPMKLNRMITGDYQPELLITDAPYNRIAASQLKLFHHDVEDQ